MRELPEYLKEFYGGMFAAQARMMGLPYGSSAQPKMRPEDAAPVDAHVAQLAALLENQTRLMASLWNAWFTSSARFWQSVMNPERKE
jgi:hypothetical protein